MITTILRIRYKLRNGHSTFSKEEMAFMVAEYDKLKAQLDQPSLPLDAPAPGAEAEATG